VGGKSGVSRPFCLAIESVVGVGKTALARSLRPSFEADLLLVSPFSRGAPPLLTVDTDDLGFGQP